MILHRVRVLARIGVLLREDIRLVLAPLVAECADRQIILGATNKQLMSAFTGVASQQVQVNAAKPGFILAAMDVYVSDFGRLKISPSRLVRSRDVLILDPEYIQVMYLRPFKWEDLAKTGDAEKFFCRVEYSLKVGNAGAHAGVFDLS